MTDKKIILAIESAVAGGSISLLSDGSEIASICGETDVSRAEDLLPNIDKLLTCVGITAKHLQLLAISNGPGSFTGIRIGASTVFGLSMALGIGYRSVPVLVAMAASHTGTVLTAVPTGKMDAAFAVFSIKNDIIDEIHRPEVIDKAQLREKIAAVTADTFVLQHDLFDVDGIRDLAPEVVNAGRNLAFLIGKAAEKGLGSSEFVPQYLQNPARQRMLM